MSDGRTRSRHGPVSPSVNRLKSKMTGTPQIHIGFIYIYIYYIGLMGKSMVSS